MQQIPCPQCKTPNPVDARFCQRCGYQVAARAADPLIGQQIGNNRILQRIGSGGMGVVYLAEHTNLGKKYAIKFLHPQYAADEEVVERFRREAQVISALEHENIIRETDFGWLPGFGFYLVMEYLEGRTLKGIIREEGALSLPRLMGIFQQLCDALDEAHEKGIVHRDLKPENLFITKRRGREVLKILDFGIARIVYGKGVAEFTVDGEVYGSPTYMSPEQAKGEIHKIDHRSDLYSVGVILFEALTGRAPYRGASPAEVMLAHLNQPPPTVTDLRPDISDNPLIDSVIRKALSKNKDDRFSSAIEFYEALLQAFPSSLPANPRLTSSWPMATGDLTPPEGEVSFSPGLSGAVPKSPAQTPSPQPGLSGALSMEATPEPKLTPLQAGSGTPKRSSPLPPTLPPLGGLPLQESPSQELSGIRLGMAASPSISPPASLLSHSGTPAKAELPSLPFPPLGGTPFSASPSKADLPGISIAPASQVRSEATHFPKRGNLPISPETTGFRQPPPGFPPMPGSLDTTGFRQKPPMAAPTSLESTTFRQPSPHAEAGVPYPPTSPIGLPSEITPGRSLPSPLSSEGITPTPSAGVSPASLGSQNPPSVSSLASVSLPPTLEGASPPLSAALHDVSIPHPPPSSDPEATAWRSSDYDISEPTRAVELSLLRGRRPTLPDAFGQPDPLLAPRTPAAPHPTSAAPPPLHPTPMPSAQGASGTPMPSALSTPEYARTYLDSSPSALRPSASAPRQPIPPPSFPPPSGNPPSLSSADLGDSTVFDPSSTPHDLPSAGSPKPPLWKDLRLLGILIGLLGGVVILVAVWLVISSEGSESSDDGGIPKPPSIEDLQPRPRPLPPPRTLTSTPPPRRPASTLGVAFQSAPQGAAVFVDGEIKPRCFTPCSLYLDSGRPRFFTLKLSGYGVRRIPWDAKESQSWHLPLTPAP